MRQTNRPQRGAIRWVRRHLTARIVLPLLVALGLLAYVSSVAVARTSGSQLWSIVGATWWLVLALTIPYLIARLLVWNILLRELQITVPWRQLIVAFAAGEMTKSLPAGIYVQNYLLGRLTHFRQTSLVRSTTATTAMLGLESLLAVPIALLVSIPGERWIAQVVLWLVVAWLIILIVLAVRVKYRAARVRADTPSWVATLLRLAEDFLTAGWELVSLQSLIAVIPTAAYMFVYVVDLHAIVFAASNIHLSFVDIISTYAIIVLAVIMIPIPTELGITEFTGLHVLIAYGLPVSTAAIVVLSLRILTTGMTILVAAATLGIMRAELESLQESA